MNDSTTQTPTWVKISIILNSLVLIALFVVGSYVFYTQSAQVALTSAPPARVETPQDKLNIAIQTENISSCNSLQSTKDKATCNNAIIFTKAQKTGDSTYCKKLINIPGYKGSSVSLIQNCENQTITSKALIQKDVSVCNEQSTKADKTTCKTAYYSYLARKENDIKICDTAKDTSVKNICHNTIVMTRSNPAQKPFACSTLRGSAAQKDCNTLKPLLFNNTNATRPSKEELIKACSSVTSSTFSGFCRSISKAPSPAK